MNVTQDSSRAFAVVFDLDGVIADTNPWHREAMREFCNRHRDEMVQVDEEMLRRHVFGFPNRAWIPVLFRAKLDLEQIDRLAFEREEIFRSMILGSIAPLEGLQELLEELTKFEVPVAIASSAPALNIELVLAETKVARYFSVILDDTAVTAGKPAPDIYLKAADDLNVPPERCMVFEDSMAGIEAGRRAGCTVIGVATTHLREELAPMTDLVISSFREIRMLELLSLIERRRLSPP